MRSSLAGVSALRQGPALWFHRPIAKSARKNVDDGIWDIIYYTTLLGRIDWDIFALRKIRDGVIASV